MDGSSWEEAYVKYGGDLVRFAATVVGPSAAEDLVAAVFLGLLRRSPRPIERADAYLYRCVLNAGRKHHRSESRRLRREQAAAALDRRDDSDVSAAVQAALNDLSPQQRAVVHLAYWEDMTTSAIAGRLGLSDGAVHKQLARARQRLRKALA